MLCSDFVCKDVGPTSHFNQSLQNNKHRSTHIASGNSRRSNRNESLNRKADTAEQRRPRSLLLQLALGFLPPMTQMSSVHHSNRQFARLYYTQSAAGICDNDENLKQFHSFFVGQFMGDLASDLIIPEAQGRAFGVDGLDCRLPAQKI